MIELKSFADVTDAELDELGGKGRNLVLLTRGGFPVPGGFVVPAECYRQWLAGIEWFDANRHPFSYDRPEAVVSEAAALRERLEQAPQDAALRARADGEAGRVAGRHRVRRVAARRRSRTWAKRPSPVSTTPI